METQIWVERPNRLLWIALSGTMTTGGLRQLPEAIVDRHNVPADYTWLIDATSLVGAELEHHEFAETAEAVSAATASVVGKRAVIANRDLIFGLWRVFEAYALAYWPMMRVCRNLGEARDWTALPARYPEALGAPTEVLPPSSGPAGSKPL